MNTELFIAKRISQKGSKKYARLIVYIAISGIALGIAVMLTSVAIVRGFKSEIKNKVNGFSGSIQINRFDLNNSLETSAFDLEDGLLNDIKSINNVKSVHPYATKAGLLRANEEIEGIIFKGIDENYTQEFLKNRIIAGSFPTYVADSISTQILLSEYTANRLKLEVGDDVLMYFIQEPIRRRKLTVSGIFKTGITELDKNYLIGDWKEIKRLNEWGENTIGGIEIHLHNTELLRFTQQTLLKKLPIYLQSTTAEQQYDLLYDWLSLLDINADVILILMLLVAGINMISALLILILERTATIGILKALGASNFSIRKIFLYHATYLILIGLLIGNAIGISFCLLQQKFKWLKLDPESYYMQYVPIEFSWVTLALLNVGTVIICLLMLLIPSMLVSRITPVKAIRFK